MAAAEFRPSKEFIALKDYQSFRDVSRTTYEGIFKQLKTQQLGQSKPTIPVTIGEEKKANPFLRADIADVAAGIGMAGAPAAKVFAEIRERKNKF